MTRSASLAWVSGTAARITAVTRCPSLTGTATYIMSSRSVSL